MSICVRERGVDKATQGAPKWPTLDATEASLAKPAQKERKKNPPTKIMPSLSSALSTHSRERTIARARSS